MLFRTTAERALHHLNRWVACASRGADDTYSVKRMAGRGSVETNDRIV